MAAAAPHGAARLSDPMLRWLCPGDGPANGAAVAGLVGRRRVRLGPCDGAFVAPQHWPGAVQRRPVGPSGTLRPCVANPFGDAPGRVSRPLRPPRLVPLGGQTAEALGSELPARSC